MEFRDLKAQYEYLKADMDKAIADVLSSSRYIMGRQVFELEKQLAEYVGARHCISCANGTDALQLALMACNVGLGDLVFVSDFSFFASAEVISLAGATPIFVDVEPDTFNMSADSLERAIIAAKEKKLGTAKAVIAVDLFGQSADYTKIRPICEKHDLLLLEDAAQSFGGSLNKKRNGSLGDISTTSFFPSKPLGCYGDGGAVFTDNEEYANIIRSLRIHGKSPSDKYDNVRIGLNSRLDSLQAAILLVKLKAFREFELERVNLAAQQYSERLKDIVGTPAIKEGFYSSWAQYSILLQNEKMRNGLKECLEENGIPAMIFYPKPLHAQKAFTGFEYDGSCPVAENIGKRILSLPIHPYISETAVELVTGHIKKYLEIV